MKQSAGAGALVERVLIEGVFDKPLVIECGPEPLTTNAGLSLYAVADRKSGLTKAIAGGLEDRRNPNFIVHAMLDLVRQRVFGLLGGYADAYGAARLRDEPTFRQLLEHALSDEAAGLASQPTLSRFENRLNWRSLTRWGATLVDHVLERERRGRKRVRRVTLDLDPTDDPVHGQQEFSFYHGHYDHRCYLPLLAFATFHDRDNAEEPERFLLTALLRPGNVSATDGALTLIRQLVRRVRRRFPEAQVRVRLDGAYATVETLELLERLRVEYVVNLPQNSVLNEWAETYLVRARLLAITTGQSACLFAERRYAAGTWHGRERRVVLKAEATLDPSARHKEVRNNPRYVVTNLRSQPEHVYREVYCQRGAAEKAIEELKNGVFLGRTGCSDFRANQARVLLTATAYVLVQEVRRYATGTAAERWDVHTFQARLTKVAAWVTESTRRWVLRFSRTLPDAALFLTLARRLAALPSG
jgi:hypothetical protein